MNAKTYIILKDELLKHPYSIHGEFDIENLFKIYTTLEINSFDDLFKGYRDFYDFVLSNIELFNVSERDKIAIKAMARHLALELETLSSPFFEKYRKNQESFANKIEKIVGNSQLQILEIGSGKIPYSSILLARDLDSITSMDKFAISDETLKKLHVEPKNEYFTADSDISSYEIIVGNKPCSAIKEVVKKCAIAGKPYFLGLCTCDSPAHELTSWEEYLKTIDSSINFSKNYEYAYNLNTPKLNFNADELEI